MTPQPPPFQLYPRPYAPHRTDMDAPPPPLGEDTPAEGGSVEPVVLTPPPPCVSVAPTGRAKCQRKGRLIECGELRFSTSRLQDHGGKTHIVASHTALVNMTKRILQKYAIDDLVSGLTGESRDVAARVMTAILHGEEPQEADVLYRAPPPAKAARKRKPADV